MKNNILTALVLSLTLSTVSAFAQQKGAELLTVRPVTTTKTQPAKTNVSAIVKEKSAASHSVHSRGFIQNPKNGDVVAEIVTFRERGFWGNGCVTQLLLDPEGRPMAVLNSSASAGPGIALVQGASFVGGMYLFAEHLKPNNQNINSGNDGGGTTVNNSNSANGGAGGTGGSASSVATGGSSSSTSAATATGGSSIATGGNAIATGGNSIATGGNGGPGRIRPPHPNSPGNGGIPGNGGPRRNP